jgi:peroxiredoxin
MPPDATGSRAGRGSRGAALGRAVVAAAVLYALYQGVMFGVRKYTDSRIHGSVGREMPSFRLLDAEGKPHDSAAWRGRPLVLNFFRSRCESCVREHPAVRAFAAEVARSGGAAVIGVIMDRVMGFPDAETRATLAEAGFNHTVLFADRAFVDAFHGAGWAKVTPVTYVVGADGRIAASLRGPQTEESLRAALRGAAR